MALIHSVITFRYVFYSRAYSRYITLPHHRRLLPLPAFRCCKVAPFPADLPLTTGALDSSSAASSADSLA